MKIDKEFGGLCINFDASKYKHLNAHALYKVVVDDDYEHPTFAGIYLDAHELRNLGRWALEVASAIEAGVTEEPI